MSAATSTMPQAWMMRTATCSSVRREAREIGLGADDREGAAVDLRAVADVVIVGRAVGGRVIRRPCAISALDRGFAAARSSAGATGASAPCRRERDRSGRRGPTSVTAVGSGRAQPLAQPETCSATSSGRRAAACEPRRAHARVSTRGRCAGRRAGAGGDGEARIGGIDDEAGAHRAPPSACCASTPGSRNARQGVSASRSPAPSSVASEVAICAAVQRPNGAATPTPPKPSAADADEPRARRGVVQAAA